MKEVDVCDDDHAGGGGGGFVGSGIAADGGGGDGEAGVAFEVFAGVEGGEATEFAKARLAPVVFGGLDEDDGGDVLGGEVFGHFANAERAGGAFEGGGLSVKAFVCAFEGSEEGGNAAEGAAVRDGEDAVVVRGDAVAAKKGPESVGTMGGVEAGEEGGTGTGEVFFEDGEFAVVEVVGGGDDDDSFSVGGDGYDLGDFDGDEEEVLAAKGVGEDVPGGFGS